jgi:hypothetical protein
MGPNLSSQDSQILHSWKEISSYAGRGVRTLQRYEANLGFPVHRPLGKPRSSVLAFTHEIDRWLSQTPSSVLRAFESDQLDGRGSGLRHSWPRLETLCATAAKWRAKTYRMQQSVSSMQRALSSMQEGFTSMLQSLERTRVLVVKSKLQWEQTLILQRRLQSNRQLHSRGISASTH